MSTKLNVLRCIVEDVSDAFPALRTWKEVYLVPKIMAVSSMSEIEIQVCEDASRYEEIEGGCRSEDFAILVGIFRKYRLDADGRHSVALSDLTLSLFQMKETIIKTLDGDFSTVKELLTRPIVIKTESAVTETADGQLLKVIGFLAGLNSEMGT